jgi:hypothetical protein
MRGVVIATVAFATALAAGVTLERVHLARAMPTPTDPVGYRKTFTERYIGNTTVIPKSVKPVVLRRAWDKDAEENAGVVLDGWLAWGKTYRRDPPWKLAAMEQVAIEQMVEQRSVMQPSVKFAAGAVDVKPDKSEKTCGPRRHKRFYNKGRSWRCSRGRS